MAKKERECHQIGLQLVASPEEGVGVSVSWGESLSVGGNGTFWSPIVVAASQQGERACHP